MKARYDAHHSPRQRGFTLVEMIVVIVITGIIGGIVAIFLQSPVKGYVDSARRAEMTDIADTALRRITRDLRLALPNSVRVTGACDGSAACYLEFLPTVGGGRYRANDAGGAGGCAAVAGNTDGDALSFTAADTCFEVLGPMPAVNVGVDQVVVYNLGIPDANAYTGNTLATDNRRGIVAAGANSLTIASANPLPFDSPSHRFQVVNTPVTYVCAPAAGGGGTLTRWWGYPIQASQPTTLPASAAPPALLADKVSDCRFAYDANVVAQRSGLVTMRLAITESGETVSLYNAAHVSNEP